MLYWLATFRLPRNSTQWLDNRALNEPGLLSPDFMRTARKEFLVKKVIHSFRKTATGVEYKTSGWKLADNRKSINFIDKKGIGRLKLKGTRDLHFYQISQIKRVRLVKRADGVYVQFCVDVERKENTEPSGTTIGLDMGLKEYYTDSNGVTVENPKFLRIGEKVLKRSVRRVSRKVRGSKNRAKAKQILGKRHLKISRQTYCTML